MRPHSAAPHAVVTGGAGFLGSHLCGVLLDQGYSVSCIDDMSTGSPENVAHLRDRRGFTLIRSDVTNGPIPVPGRDPVRLILHLASPASPMDYLRLPLHTLDTGALGTRNALALAREHGARLVFASTSETYGDPQEHPQHEEYWGHVNPVGPRSVYDEAKRFAEALVTADAAARGTDAGIVRLFNTYGPRMRGHDGRAVPTFIRQALAGEPLTVSGDGSQTRSLAFVDDTVRGVLAMADSDLLGPVNIGNPDETTMGDLANTIIRLTGSSSTVRYISRPVDDPAVRCPDITLARGKLQWEPRVPAEDGLRRTIAWFRDGHLTGSPGGETVPARSTRGDRHSDGAVDGAVDGAGDAARRRSAVRATAPTTATAGTLGTGAFAVDQVGAAEADRNVGDAGTGTPRTAAATGTDTGQSAGTGVGTAAGAGACACADRGADGTRPDGGSSGAAQRVRHAAEP